MHDVLLRVLHCVNSATGLIGFFASLASMLTFPVCICFAFIWKFGPRISRGARRIVFPTNDAVSSPSPSRCKTYAINDSKASLKHVSQQHNGCHRPPPAVPFDRRNEWDEEHRLSGAEAYIHLLVLGTVVTAICVPGYYYGPALWSSLFDTMDAASTHVPCGSAHGCLVYYPKAYLAFAALLVSPVFYAWCTIRVLVDKVRRERWEAEHAKICPHYMLDVTEPLPTD